MSGICAVVCPADQQPHERELRAMLSAMGGRGAESFAFANANAILGGRRYAREAPAARGPSSDLTAAVADATLYYRGDLCRRLKREGVSVDRGATVEELLVAAYRAWGARLAEYLEGDFAFAIHDAKRDLLVCARDFCGRRPLFYARAGDRIALASTPGALLAHPKVSDTLDLSVVAATAAGFFALREETAFQAIRSLQPGHTLVWSGESIRVAPHWRPPPIEERFEVPSRDFERDAEELRELLVSAVSERLDSGGPTAVWLSGGYDSTAVWAAGHVARSRGTKGLLRAVSVSYPPDDPGCEDPLIESTARWWDAEPHWLDIRTIPLLSGSRSGAVVRDEPFAHVFEGWNRALARGTAASGCTVALDGVGGDHLFQVSPVALAALLHPADWPTLRREWRAQRMRGWRNFARWAILPHLSDHSLRALSLIRGGRPLQGYLDRPIPPWIRVDFLEAQGVLAREARNTPARDGLGPAAYETQWYLTHPFGGRILSCVSSIALREGVELRSPLMDGRVVAFALSRPLSERSQGAESKRLLRRAMHGLLPPEVLDRRPHRTGITSRYLVESMRSEGDELIREAFAGSRLADLGIVDEGALLESWDSFLRRPDENVAVALSFSLHAELWLQALECRSGGVGTPPILVGRGGAAGSARGLSWDVTNNREESWTSST